jgi:hypothetical protein
MVCTSVYDSDGYELGTFMMSARVTKNLSAELELDSELASDSGSERSHRDGMDSAWVTVTVCQCRRTVTSHGTRLGRY